MHLQLINEGLLLNKNNLKDDEIKTVKKDLTVCAKSFLKTFKPIPFKIYKESKNYIFVPRFYNKFGFPKNVLCEGDKMSSISFCGNLLEKQKLPYEKLITSLTECGGGILSLPCGFGKTILSIAVALSIGRKCGIVVNKEDLGDQWEKAILKFTNNMARIGRIQQDVFDIKDKDFVICIVHTLARREINKDEMKTFGIFIIDECHHLASEMFSQALPKINCKYVVGLSATLVRKDGLTPVLHYFLGPLCYSEKRQGNSNLQVVQIKLKSNSPEYQVLYLCNGNKNTTGMISKLTTSKNRNKLIIDIIISLMKEQRKIILLSGIRAHLDELYSLLEIHSKGITFGYYRGNDGSNKKSHKKMLEESSKADVLLATHHIASEGLDIPELNTLIFATPMCEVEQSVGRIQRKEHKVTLKIIDIVDDFGNFVKQSYNRMKLYNKEKYTVKKNVIKLDTYVSDSEYIDNILNDHKDDDLEDDNDLEDDEDDENDDLEDHEDQKVCKILL